MRQVVLIGSISVCILLVVLLFKLNKTKIEYDNKLVALNRKVRDLTNLIDLSNTKQNLIKESTGEVVGESVSEVDKNIGNDTSTNIEEQYKNFVDNNDNFFETLDNFNSNLPEDIKHDIDNFVNNEIDVNKSNEEISTTPNVEDVEEVDAVEDVDALEAVDAVEDVDSLEAVEDVEEVDALEDVEEVDAVEDVEGVEEVEDVEAVDAVEDVEGVEEVEDVEGVEGVEEVEDAEEVDAVDAVDAVEEVDAVEDVEEVDAVYAVETNTSSEHESLMIKLDTMTLKELQDMCRENKLKIKGRKDELVERIKDNLSLYSL